MPGSVVTAPAKRLLGNVSLYLALQRAVGADRLRYRSIEVLDPKPGERVLDVGCGPAYYLDALPPVDYVGFDTDCHYIDWARRKWGGRGRFECEEFTEAWARRLGPFDAVLLMGLLHHLPDEACDELLRVLAQSLTPAGRVVTVDTAYVPGQGRVSRWMSDNDRGQHVRRPEEFAALAGRHFAQVDTTILDDVTRVPSAFCMMRLANPLAA